MQFHFNIGDEFAVIAIWPLQSSKNRLFQNKAKCKTFLVKISFICMTVKNHFQVKGLAHNLVLIQRPRGTWIMAY